MRTKLLILACCIGMAARAQVKTLPLGNNSQIQYDLDKGTYQVIFHGNSVIRNAYAVCRSRGHRDSSTEAYTSRTLSRMNGYRGPHTKAFLVTMKGDGLPTMQQEFEVNDKGSYFVTTVSLEAPGCDYMSPMTTDAVDLHETDDMRALFMPFDNDAWVRYNAFPLASADYTSSEATALYSNGSRHGLILGSMGHAIWKTGIRVKGSGPGALSSLTVFGGYTDKTYTHDIKGHGEVRAEGQFCWSPRIMIGWFGDWRTGLETYGRFAKDISAISRWTGSTPFGWNSWGAMQDKLTLPKARAVVDFFHDSCKTFHTGGNTLYIDLDSYWDMLVKGGLNGDISQLKEFCAYCKSRGFQPGVYWAPFVDWGRSARKMEGSDYDYSNCWIRQNGQFIDLDGARALDPTHPGTKARIALVIGKFKECGFKMIKIDFLGHATLEADHFYDTTVHTGMQAFAKGMRYLSQQLDNTMLVYAAISPNMATAPFVHMRRIACDAYSHINETAYTLNSVTYGWWLGKLYDFIDADHVVFKNEPAGMNRARLVSALVTGTLITGDDYSVAGPWQATARTLLQNEDLLQVAREGHAFTPVEGNTGDKPGNFFVRKGKHAYLAIVNYSDTALRYTIDAARWGIPSGQPIKELFSGETLLPGTRTVTVPPADAVIYRVDQSPSSNPSSISKPPPSAAAVASSSQRLL
jgi:alpha-galactosidase